MTGGLMSGKRGLVMGVANDHSIAWGIAKRLAADGAELAFTYQPPSMDKRVRPLAESVKSDFVIPCHVGLDPDSGEAGAVGTVIANMVRSMPLSDEQLRTFADGNGSLRVPGFDEADNKTLAAEFGAEATRTLDHRRLRTVLDGFGKPVAEVAFDPGGIDENAVFVIADTFVPNLAAYYLTRGTEAVGGQGK